MAKTVHSKVVVSAKDNVSPALDKLQTKFRVFAKSAHQFGDSFKKISTVGLVGFAGGLTASIVAARKAAQEFANYGGSVDDTSRSLSIAAGALQGFRYAADLGGSSASEMDGAIATLNKNMANAAAGSNKNLVKLMGDLGISMKDANGKMKTSAELIPEIADAIKSQTNSTQKAYIATQFFGKSGQNLIKTLSDGSEGLYAARKEAEDFGLVLSQDDVTAAAEFSDTMTRTDKAIQGVWVTIGKKLMPLLRPLVDGFNEWIKANREWMATTITELIMDFANALKSIDFRAVADSMVDLIKKTVDFYHAMGGIKTVLWVVGAMLAGQTVIGIVSAATAFGKIVSVVWTCTKAVWGFNAALLANPITWIVVGILAAVAAIAGAVYLIYDNWDSIASWFTDLFNDIADTSVAIFNGFVNFFTETVPNAIKSTWEALKDWFLDIVDAMLAPAMKVVDTVSGITGAVGNGISSAWDSVASFFGGGSPQPQAVPVGGALGMGDNRFNGAMEIHVKTDAGAQAEVTDTRSDSRAVALKVTQDKGASR